MGDLGPEGQARSAEDLRDDFLEACRTVVDYWADPVTAETYDTRARLSGALHSFLCLVDGVSSSFPCSLDLVCSPHPDDKTFHQAEGDDWIEPGTVINKGVYLHDLLYRRGRWAHEPQAGRLETST